MTKIILFNKPYDVVCQFSGDIAELTLAHYIKIPHFYAAGRLDKNSEGLLLLTDNGKFQHQLTHPTISKKKYYWVQVEGTPTEEDLFPLRKGIQIKNLKFLPAQVQSISEPLLWPRNPPIRFRKNNSTTWLEIILTEGKNHQIRKMTAAIGFPTLRLIRYKIDKWDLGNLQPGEYTIYSI